MRTNLLIYNLTCYCLAYKLYWFYIFYEVLYFVYIFGYA